MLYQELYRQAGARGNCLLSHKDRRNQASLRPKQQPKSAEFLEVVTRVMMIAMKR
jgi:hypothetical protein